MLHNLRKIILMSIGSLLLLTVSLWLLGFAAPPVNPPAIVTRPVVTGADAAQPAQTTLEISSTVRLTGTKRLGMNLGGHVERGGSYLLKNLIRNPGFEAGEYNMIFLAQPGATATRVQANWGPNGLRASQPISFWDGAAYEIISGTASLRNGTVLSFTHENGNDTFYLAEPGPAPATGNVIMVSQTITGYCCAAAFTQPFHAADPSQTRPGSPGVQSLRLITATPATAPSWRYVIDGFAQNQDQSAGKLLLVNGSWHFAIWARAATVDGTLNVRLRRPGVPAFLSETIPLSTTWQQITRTFTPPVSDDPEGITTTLALDLRPGGGPVWVDDIVLTRSGQISPTVFSDKVVARLQELRPGLLRNWGMQQLGSTLDNQLAEPWARRTNGYQPDLAQATQWHYSVHEFLQLAELIAAEPCYVIPPTFFAAELQNLVAYLAAPSDAHPYAEIRASLGQTQPWTAVFSTIHLELGNEMWGGLTQTNPFLGASVGGTIAGVNGGTRLGQMAHNRFAIMRSSPFFTPRLDLVIGSQADFPTRTRQIESRSDQHDSIALAPYFYTNTQPISWATNAEIFYPLFAWPRQDVQANGRVGAAQGQIITAGHGTELAVYEINFHSTVAGTMPITQRNDLVTGLGGGLALPLFMLTYQRELGIRHQNVWRMAAFSNRVEGTSADYVRIFGTLRDLEATGRKRPTWLGVELANRAIRGDLLATNFTGDLPTWVQTPRNGIHATIDLPLLQAFAYREGDEYAVMLFNLDLTNSHVLQLRLPSPPQATATLHTLSATSIYSNNEASEQVQIITTPITDFAQHYPLTLAPHSAYVVQWQAAGIKPTVYLSVVLN